MAGSRVFFGHLEAATPSPDVPEGVIVYRRVGPLAAHRGSVVRVAPPFYFVAPAASPSVPFSVRVVGRRAPLLTGAAIASLPPRGRPLPPRSSLLVGRGRLPSQGAAVVVRPPFYFVPAAPAGRVPLSVLIAGLENAARRRAVLMPGFVGRLPPFSVTVDLGAASEWIIRARRRKRR